MCKQVEGRTENWCGVLQEVALPGAELAEASAFLPAATAFANDRLDGNLSCTLLVHPRVSTLAWIRRMEEDGSLTCCAHT